MIGTKWYKCDLHLHTPASKCFHDKNVTPQQWIQEALDKGLNCVAVTDHNTADWVDAIQHEATSANLIVFPGVELTCSDSKVHLLVLFERGTTRRQIEDFMTLCRIDAKMFGEQEAHSPLSVEQVFEEVKKQNAICIPAHIDEYSGLCEVAFTRREALFQGDTFLGVQVVHPDLAIEENKYKKQEALAGVNKFRGVSEADIASGKLKVNDESVKKWRGPVTQAHTYKKAILTFSDNPHAQNDSKHGLWGMGRRHTWIKMDQKPGLESLRQALLLQKFRIKSDFDGGNQPYTEPETWIQSISITETELSKPGEVLEISFSPQMNTVIGGRGSGKSSILQFLRGVFQKDSELNSLDALKLEFANFFKTKDKKKQGVLKAACCIDILINRRGEQFKVSFTQDTPITSNRQIYKFNETTNQFDPLPDLAYLKILDFEIYSQKQIYEMANNLNSLRERIDISSPEIIKQQEVLEARRADYIQHAAAIRALKQKVLKKDVLKAEIQDLEHKISKVQEAGIESELRRLEELNLENRNFEKLIKDVAEGVSQFDSLASKVQLNKLTSEMFSPASVELLQPTIDNLNEQLDNIFLSLEMAKSDFNDVSSDLAVTLSTSTWASEKQQTEKSFNEKKQTLINQGIAKIDEVEADMKLLSTKKQELKDIEKFEADVIKSEELLLSEKASFVEDREKLTTVRKTFLSQLLTDGKVKAKVAAFQDFNHLEGRIREALGASESFDKDIAVLKDYWSGPDAKRTNEGVFKMITEIHNKTSSGDEFERRFSKKIEGLNGEQLDSFDLMFPEDVIQLEYLTNAKVWKPLSNASAGQKTAAILTLILAEGTKPLLLDQPEDDLDNHLIYDLVVDQLRKSKEVRQIITVTHNANIPVNGDSEILIVMDSETKYLSSKQIGTIEEEDIKNAICSIMEGGIDAFNMRSKRYQNVSTNV